LESFLIGFSTPGISGSDFATVGEVGTGEEGGEGGDAGGGEETLSLFCGSGWKAEEVAASSGGGEEGAEAGGEEEGEAAAAAAAAAAREKTESASPAAVSASPPRKTHEAGGEDACLWFSVKRIFSSRIAMGKELDGGARRLEGV
jgi:hypothetical protein